MTRRTKGGTRISDKDEEIYEPGSEIESLGDETSRSSANSESEGDSFKGSISDDELFSGDEQTYFSNDIESYSDYEADEQLEDTSLGEGEEEFSDFDSYITTISPSLLGSRPASTLPADGEEESTAQKIIESLSNILPEVAYAEPAASPTIMTTLPIPSSAQPIRMTDLGFKISQMVLNKRETTTQTASTQIGPLVDVSSVFGEQEDMEDMVAEGEDPLLERTLSGRRRNRTGIRGRPKKVDYGFGKSTTHVLPPPIAKLMGQANMAYVSRRYEEATQLLLEVVRQAPHAYEAYQTLGMIHEEMSDFEKAISYFVIAVHLGKHDVDLWRKLADLTLKLGRHQEAIYYLGRLIRMKNPLPEYFWTRARLWAEREDYKKAIQGFHRLLLVEIQGNGILFNQVLCFAERVEMSDIALDLFVQVIKEAVTNQRIPSFAVTLQVLAALDGRQEWDRITALIELLAVPIAANSGQSSISSGWFALSEEDRRMIALSELPLEVRLCYDIARLHLKQEVTVEYASRIEVPRYGGQLFKLGKALLSQTRAKEALGLLFPLLDVPQFANADLGALLGECYRLIPGQEQTALDTLETVLLVDPARNDVRNAMIDLYRQMGNMERAVKTMEGLTGEEPVEIFENRLGQGLNALFEGLYSWDRSGISTPEGGSQAILHLPDYAPPRKRSGRRRRRRLRKYSSFTPQQQQATQAVFVRIPTLYAARDPVSLRSLKQITVPLIEDMLGNPFIRPPEDSKIISNTTDLALLHGLTIIQWRSVLVHYLIAEEKVGSPERALKILRILLGKSVFLSDPDSHWTLRLLHVSKNDRPSWNYETILILFRISSKSWKDIEHYEFHALVYKNSS